MCCVKFYLLPVLNLLPIKFSCWERAATLHFVHTMCNVCQWWVMINTWSERAYLYYINMHQLNSWLPTKNLGIVVPRKCRAFSVEKLVPSHSTTVPKNPLVQRMTTKSSSNVWESTRRIMATLVCNYCYSMKIFEKEFSTYDFMEHSITLDWVPLCLSVIDRCHLTKGELYLSIGSLSVLLMTSWWGEACPGKRDIC